MEAVSYSYCFESFIFAINYLYSSFPIIKLPKGVSGKRGAFDSTTFIDYVGTQIYFVFVY